MAYLMKCGHSANAQDSQGNPVCVICVGVDPGATEVEKEAFGTEGLEGREAKCSCGNHGPSKWELPFFEYQPEASFDKYYCGCRGWD